MRGKRLSIGLRAALAMFASTLFVMSTRAVGQEKVLHSFNDDHIDGFRPQAGLILDTAGNLYGTTPSGGAYGYADFGTVFELTPGPAGSWTEKLLHIFNSNGTDGTYPPAGVIFEAAFGRGSHAP